MFWKENICCFKFNNQIIETKKIKFIKLIKLIALIIDILKIFFLKWNIS